MTNGYQPRRNDRILRRILEGASDSSIRFDELRRLLFRLGFSERIRGSHHIYRKQGVDERIGLQPRRGMAKDYQVRQLRAIFFKYGVWDWLS